MVSKSTYTDNISRSGSAARTGRDEHRDAILADYIHVAKLALDMPDAFVSVMDDEQQLIKSVFSVNPAQDACNETLHKSAAGTRSALIVTDARKDERFAASPLVTGPPFIRFLAGIPLLNHAETALGTLCITDTSPHHLSEEQKEVLRLLAELLTALLEAWRSAGLTDVVTGLPNRQCLTRDITHLPYSADAGLCRLTLIDCMEISRLYELARTVGMGLVEELLRDIVDLLRLRLNISATERLYTTATGRFALLSQSDESFSARAVSEKLQGLSGCLQGGIPVTLKVHCGDTCFKPHALSAQEILRRAVSALHEAMDINAPAASFDENTDSQRNDDFLLITDLANALRKDYGLFLVYQPKICLRTGSVTGLEALIRWRHPVRGDVSPVFFLPLVAQTGLLSELTDWVIDATVIQLQHWQNTRAALQVSINVSVSDISRSGFAERLEHRMLQARLPVSLLAIECLESERIGENSAAVRGLEALKRKGFRISLDDFGAGYSNISYLGRMPLDIIKLDQSLISRMSVDTSTRIIARNVITMLRELEYTVLAEGVEDEETAELLCKFGCHEAQGYYFSPPLEPAALVEWLSGRQTITFRS